MKRVIVFLSCLIPMCAFAQFKVTSTGYVGLGNILPLYKLDLTLNESQAFRIQTWTETFIDRSGQYGSTCFYPIMDYYLQFGKDGKRVGQIWACEIHGIWQLEYSDLRIKENIRPIENPLEKVLSITGIKYNLKESFINSIPEEKKIIYMGDEYGFNAQELREIIPEVVEEDSSGILNVKYTRVIPLLVEAIKVQQQQIDSINNHCNEQIIEMQRTIETMSARLSAMDNEMQGNSAIESSINIVQNTPNPFSQSTTISCIIPQETASAKICFFDVYGTQRKCIPIEKRGAVSVSIEASDLPAGVYVYFLQCDNSISEVKQMIINK